MAKKSATFYRGFVLFVLLWVKANGDSTTTSTANPHSSIEITTSSSQAPKTTTSSDADISVEEIRKRVNVLIAEAAPLRAYIGDIGLNGTEQRIGLLPEVNREMLEDTEPMNPLNDEDFYQTLVRLTVEDAALPRIPGHAYWEPESPPAQLRCGGFTTGGEDAFFFNDTTGVFGVADGVGGTTSDSGSFARNLCHWSERAAQFYGRGGYGHTPRDPELSKAVMHEASRMAQEQAHPKALNVTMDDVMGSTLIVGMLDTADHYNVANMGDCGLSVYRRRPETRYLRALALQTAAMQGGWNMPLAFSSIPQITAEHAESYYAPAEVGDLVVIGSDGLYDAMFEPEVAALLARSVSPLESGRLAKAEEVLGDDAPWQLKMFGDVSDPERYATPPDLLAKYLVLVARWYQANSRTVSPFEIVLRHEGKRFAFTSKPDDTTAVVCWVVS